MKPIEIEFFHDTICSFCFPMSYRMRQLQEKMPHAQIFHRSFALVKKPEDFDYMFGSREAAKREVLQHWEHANEVDDLRRFNIEGMKKQTFLFPTSMNALYACKAAGFTAGESGYWDTFDALQYAFFVENRNIEDYNVIASAIKLLSFDFDTWNKYYLSEAVKEAVLADFSLVNQYGIKSVPTLVVNKSLIISGTQPLDRIIERLEKAQ